MTKTYESTCVRCHVRKAVDQFPKGEGGRHKRICAECMSQADGLKRCTACKEAKARDQFHKQGNAPDGLSYNCKDCVNENSRAWETANKERRAARSAAWYQENRDRQRAWHKAQNQARKRDVIIRYGGVCACCGEANIGFLILDHVNNDGAEHRKSLGHGKSSSKIYRWAQINGYPDVLQVLCMNCNCGKQWNGGVCPHEEERNGRGSPEAGPAEEPSDGGRRHTHNPGA